MREILDALMDDSSRQMKLLESAIRQQDSKATMRLAHYSKGACANVGAIAAAAVLREIESQAGRGDFKECGASLAVLAHELDRLRTEVAAT